MVEDEGEDRRVVDGGARNARKRHCLPMVGPEELDYCAGIKNCLTETGLLMEAASVSERASPLPGPKTSSVRGLWG